MKKKSTTEKILILLGAAALMVVGFMVIPPLIDKWSKKVYKASLKNEEIDFDDMGPEIVPKDEEE